jgi:hypothetical protein
MPKYDPEDDPNPAKWLALDETERIAIVRHYHRKIRAELPSVDAHAAAHAIVENQLAEGLPEAKSALERLLGEGLDRHESIHAIASVLMAHIWNLANRPQSPGDPHAPYLAELNNLTAESWRRSG